VCYSVWDLCWTKQQWHRCFSEHFSFRLSGSFYQCSKHIIYSHTKKAV